MKKWFLMVSVMIGSIGNGYASLMRLAGMGVYHPEINLREYAWVVDDPILIHDNGAIIYRFSNEVGIEPQVYPYTGIWKDASAYALLNQEWFSLGILINDQPEPEDYLSHYPKSFSGTTFPGGNTPENYSMMSARDRKPWFEMVIGSQRIPFNPYLGVSISAAVVSTNYEHIPTPPDPTKALVYGEEVASLWKIKAGASVDMFKPFTLDASLSVWIPLFSIQRRITMTEISGYQNEEKQVSEGNFGVEARLYPQIKLSPHLEWRNKLMYRYLNLNSTHTVTINLNGDGDFTDPGELKSRNTHPQTIQTIIVGTGVNYLKGNILAFCSLNNYTVLRTDEWFNVNQSSGSDVYTDKENTNMLRNYTILNGGAEVNVTKWLSFRTGATTWYLFESKTFSSFAFSGTTETMRDILTHTSLATMFLAQMGFSLHFGGFSLDWMINDIFIARVARGILPYIISGNNSFDEFSITMSLRYNF